MANYKKFRPSRENFNLNVAWAGIQASRFRALIYLPNTHVDGRLGGAR